MRETELQRRPSPEDREGLVVRRRAPIVSSRVEEVRERLFRSQMRLREAIVRVQETAREMSPAARIESKPVTWVMGAFAIGLAIGLLTAKRR